MDATVYRLVIFYNYRGHCIKIFIPHAYAYIRMHAVTPLLFIDDWKDPQKIYTVTS